MGNHESIITDQPQIIFTCPTISSLCSTYWAAHLLKALQAITTQKLTQIRSEQYGKRERALNSLLYADLATEIARLFHDEGADPRAWYPDIEQVLVKLVREEHFLGNFDRKFGDCPHFKDGDLRSSDDYQQTYRGLYRCSAFYDLLRYLLMHGVRFTGNFNIMVSALHDICYGRSESIKSLLFNLLLWSRLSAFTASETSSDDNQIANRFEVRQLTYLCPMNVDHRFMDEQNIHCVYHIDQRQECRHPHPEEFANLNALSKQVPRLQAIVLQSIRSQMRGPNMVSRLQSLQCDHLLPAALATDVSYVDWSRAHIYDPDIQQSIESLFSVKTIVRVPRTWLNDHDEHS